MGDWRVHTGIDFQTLDGERVSAVADGTVKDIYYDAMLGYCIRIAHSDGIESLYCNLMKNATVKKEDTQSKQVILSEESAHPCLPRAQKHPICIWK